MLELEEALARILAALPAATPERVPLSRAHGRVAAEAVPAPMDLPVFDNSSVDGYAVRAADVAAAAAQRPVPLRCSGRVAAGETYSGELATGACARLFTGAPLPAGADAVVMQEDVRVEAGRPEVVLVTAPVTPWENVRFRGEDVKRGATVIGAGEILTAGHLALGAALGLTHLSAGRRPVTGLVATGSELREPGEPLGGGQIYESNRVGLASLARRAGALVRVFPIVPDTADATRSAIERAWSGCDVVVTSGGVSVGETDLVKDSFTALGGALEFWKVSIKPGRPFVFGRRGGRLLFGLPGNPVSALVTFLLLVRPALRRFQGAGSVGLPVQRAIAAEPLANDGSRRHFLRVRVAEDGAVRLAGTQASHILGSFARANGLVDLAPRTILAKGEKVDVLRWE
jgi:molybdopterin molybdotransferase